MISGYKCLIGKLLLSDLFVCSHRVMLLVEGSGPRLLKGFLIQIVVSGAGEGFFACARLRKRPKLLVHMVLCYDVAVIPMTYWGSAKV